MTMTTDEAMKWYDENGGNCALSGWEELPNDPTN
jgi:hypothetical protein